MYEVRTIDLTNIFAETTIVQPQRRIAEVFVNDVPTGASFKMRVGDGNPQMTVSRPFAMEPKGDDEANRGLMIENVAAQAGSKVEIVIVYGSGADQLNTVT